MAHPIVPSEWVGGGDRLIGRSRREGRECLPDVLSHRQRAGLEVHERLAARSQQDL